MFGKKPSFFIIAAFIMVLGLAPISGSAFIFFSASVAEEPAIIVEILDAYYTDLDNDSVEDDVFSVVQVTVNVAPPYAYDYLVELFLPSGKSHSFYYWIYTNVDVVVYENHFLNQATEKGWYRLEASAILVSSQLGYSENIYVFDPPGGSGGAEPPTHDLFPRY